MLFKFKFKNIIKSSMRLKFQLVKENIWVSGQSFYQQNVSQIILTLLSS